MNRINTLFLIILVNTPLLLVAQEKQNYVLLAKNHGLDTAINILNEEIAKTGTKSPQHLDLSYEKYRVYSKLGKTHLAYKEINKVLNGGFNLDKEQIVKYSIKKHNELYRLEEREKALASLLKARQQLGTDSDKILFAKIDRSIGIFYSKIEDFDKAKPYLLNSLGIYEKENDTSGRINVLMSLGNCYKENEQLDSALICYETSLDLSKKARKQRGVAGNLNNIANVYRRQDKANEAIELLKEAVKINAFDGNRLWESFNYNNIGNTYADLGEHNKAIEYYLKSVAVKKELDEKFSLIQSYSSLAKQHAEIGDHKTAYEYSLLEKELREESKKVDIEKALANLAAKYKYGVEIQENDTDVKTEEVDNTKSPTKKGSNNGIWFWLTFVFGAISLFLVVMLMKKKN